jgi:two-component system response regulator WspF
MDRVPGQQTPLRVGLVDPDARRGARLGRLLAYDPAATLVGIAGDGTEALDLARRARPDVMLLAPTLPRLDGLTALRLLRESTEVAAVMLAEEAEVECVLDALALGAVGTVRVGDPALAEPGGLRRHLQALLAGGDLPARVLFSELSEPTAVEVSVPMGRVGAVAPFLRDGISADAALVVIEDPTWMVDPLARRLHHSTSWRVLAAVEGDVLATGHVLITAREHHHSVRRDARGRLRVATTPPRPTTPTIPEPTTATP